jgi:predicted AlkP superfamily phosphohydrolase/phosphomutase
MNSIILGFDAFDPNIFEALSNQGKMPNLSQYLDSGDYARFDVSNPAQSEVSWTSIATGLNPGGHGLFDFVHRNPANYSLHVSMLPTKKGLLGIQFTRPYTAKPIFDHATEQGYPATALWWPAMFPARLESPVHTLPGLGTPDILGRLGAGTFYSPIEDLSKNEFKTNIEYLESLGEQEYEGELNGPMQKKGSIAVHAKQAFKLSLNSANEASLRIGKNEIHLHKGKWSPIIQLSFKIKLGISVRAISRALFTDYQGKPGLYFLPLQIHPLHPPWPYAHPRGFVKTNWESSGPFLTLGWPQDTTGLEEGFINDEQFLALCRSIFSTRENIFQNQLKGFKEGILANVFDSLDRVQHMFFRDRPDIIEEWYREFDALFGRIEGQISAQGLKDTRVLVVSDHGFSNLDYKVHLNRWLIENGYLHPKEDGAHGSIKEVDWNRSRAYAVGLTSIYINLADRESKGIVPVSEKGTLRTTLKADLLRWTGPDGRKVCSDVWFGDDVFIGPLSQYGPDLVVGYNSGYRASPKTGLGQWEQEAIIPNSDHWGADHCQDPALVQGVLFTNFKLGEDAKPSYTDIPDYVIGKSFEPMSGPPVSPPDFVDEDEQVLEERLRDLGYL